MWKCPKTGRPSRERHGERQLVGGQRGAVRVERPEPGVPLLAGEGPGLLEGAADDLRGRVVVEDDLAVDVDQERGQRDDRDQVARQDQLERFLALVRDSRRCGAALGDGAERGHAATPASASTWRGSSVSRAMTRRWICDVPS